MGKDSNRVRLTAGRVQAFECPAGKSQAFLWDTDTPCLLLRVSPTGRRTYAFEGRLCGDTIRVTIGTVADWSLDQARQRAAELKRQVDLGQDPRQIEREQQEQRAAAQAAVAAQQEQERLGATTVGEAWAAYLVDRQPVWGERHYADHVKMAKAGGEVTKRGVKANPDGSKPLTVPGPVHELLCLELRELTTAKVEAWAAKHAKVRPTWARLCWRCLKVFLNWCAEHPDFGKLLASANPAKTKRARETLGKPSAKDDALQREQLPAWFSAVRQIQNPAVAAYLQTMLLTGARPTEVLTMRWEDVNTQWKGITIRDKVEGERVIPLTPYVAHLLAGLPRRNEWVFASTRALKMDDHNTWRRLRNAEAAGRDAVDGDVAQASASGHLADPSAAHRCACATVGLEGLTLHGLRRSFASLTEWLEVPTGVVAQIQGHKPSATAEKHYKRRPLDLLRVHHERIEAWVLEQAGIKFDVAGSALRVV